jgi:arylsulfatase A-like enzyme
LLASVLVLCGCTAPDSGLQLDTEIRHVIVISLDTTRADHLGFYGNETVKTPHLDRLARESIVLDDVTTTAPTTLAAHASLFTGTYPHTHGAPRNGFVLHEDNRTLAEMLEEYGFVTAGFAASFALAGRFGIAQGFEHYDESFEFRAVEGGRFQDERPAAAVTDAVIDYLKQKGVPDRLFLFAHYFDAHSPYAPPSPYDTMYDERGHENLPNWHAVSDDCMDRGVVKTPPGERMAAQYAGEISYMDEHLGRLLDDLRERGVLDDALLLVTSDHGENHWEHFYCFDHGWSVYQTTARAVGVLRLPGGAEGGTRITSAVSTIDLLPTLLSKLNAPIPESVEGRPIELVAGAYDVRTVFVQATKPWEKVETDPRWTNMNKMRSIRQGPYKLIQVPWQQGREELYDLEADPGETENLLAEPTADATRVADDLRVRLEAWAESADPLPSKFEDITRDETIERLKALGYLGGG